MKWEICGKEYGVIVERMDGWCKTSSILHPDEALIVVRIPSGLKSCCEESCLASAKEGLAKKMSMPPKPRAQNKIREYRNGEKLVLLEKPFTLKISDWDNKGLRFELKEDERIIEIMRQMDIGPDVYAPALSRLMRRGLASILDRHLHERLHALYHNYISPEEPPFDIASALGQSAWLGFSPNGNAKIALRAIFLGKDQLDGIIMDAFRRKKIEPKRAPFPNVIDAILREIEPKKGLKV